MRNRLNAAICCITAALAYTPSPSVHAAAGDAEVVLAVGKVEARDSASGEWKPVKLQQQLPAGAAVRTGEASQAALLLKDQTQVRVNQQSTVQFKAITEPGQETTLDLIQGRIWAQVKRALYAVTKAVAPARALKMTTPTATIGIRGTDWDVEVGPDGKTTVTVLSGVVDMENPFGRVAIASNEQAVAEPGKAPVKRLLSDAADRVQWVTAYRPSPRRWVPTPSPALETAAKAIETGDYAAGLRLLQAAGPSVEMRLMRADMFIFLGRAGEAIELLSRESAPAAKALQGRALAVAGRLDEARRLLVQEAARQPGNAEIALALADVARLQGEADEALRLFAEVTAAQPKHSEGWFGVGRIQTEKENLRPARTALDEAIRLAPDAAGYWGERATLEALAGDYAAARTAFAEALRRQPDDYVAWTGLGILQLKTGQTEAALESFLKAGVLEPRFARAQLYAGVAYYRLENRKAALESVQRAAQLDAKDPLPYIMLGLIHGDALELRAATDAARAAQERMPFLKSLNQVLNNQKGSANVGSALAAQGMEEWARAYASASYNPYWAGSALFLADRYADGFNKNSELYKGFLLDPTVFGASNRASSLVQSPGHYGSLAYIGTLGDWSQQTLQGKVNGLANDNVPFAYSLTGELADGYDGRTNQTTFRANGNNLTLGLGVRPNHETGLFYFVNDQDVRGRFSDPALLPDARLRVDVTRQDAGVGYRIGPVNQIWVKVGDGSQGTRLSGTQIDATTASQLTAPAILTTSATASLDRNDVDVRQNDLQFRHSFEPAAGTRVSWGIEDSRDRLSLVRDQTYSSTAILPCIFFGGCPVMPRVRTSVDRDLRSSGVYLSASHRHAAGLETQIDIHYQHIRTNSVVDVGNAQNNGTVIAAGAVTREQDDFRGFNPRIGIQFAPAAGIDLRAAYQRWRRPFGTGSLGLTDTAGIAVEDRLVDSGGLLTRTKARIDWQYDTRRFLQFSVDRREVENLQGTAAPYFRQFGLSELAALRARKPVFDEAFDELEKTPLFTAGTVTSGSAALNWLATDDVTFAARYVNSASRNTSAAFPGMRVPYIPRHFLNVAAFWQAGGRWLLSGVANYRSHRHTNEANSAWLDAGWTLGLRAYWESEDKRWSVEAAANNLHSDKSAAIEQRAQFNINSTYRF